MDIGCIKETKKYEYRVGIRPDNVRDYVKHGHKVFMEAGAGLGSGFTDDEYIVSGAEIMETPDEIFEAAEMIVKVKEPLESEYKKIRQGQILFTYLHLAANRELTDAVLESGAKAVAYETIRDRSGGLPLLRPMSEIAGRLSIQEGAKYLEKPNGGSGILLSGVPGVHKANVLILGGGTAGTNACKMAVGLGTNVTIADVNLDRLVYLDDIFGGSIQTVFSTDAVIERECQDADLVIGTVLLPGAAAPKLIKRSYLKEMKPGSVIVDVAVDQGGCCETTKPTYHDDPIFLVDGVVHYCVANMPGAVPRTSTIALTNATLSYGLAIADNGLEGACAIIPGLSKGVNCYEGRLTCQEVGEAFDMHTYDINASMKIA